MYEQFVISIILLLFIHRSTSDNNTSTIEGVGVYNISTKSSTAVTTSLPHVTSASLSSTSEHEALSKGSLLNTTGGIATVEPTQTTQTKHDDKTTTSKQDHSVGDLSNKQNHRNSTKSTTTTDSSKSTGRENTKTVTKATSLNFHNYSTASKADVTTVTITKQSSAGSSHHSNTKVSHSTVKHKATTQTNKEGYTAALTDESRDNITNTGRLQYVYDEFDAGDKFWPVGMALTIGIPTIIVLAVTITVLYKRQVAKPRSRLSFYGQNYAKM